MFIVWESGLCSRAIQARKERHRFPLSCGYHERNRHPRGTAFTTTKGAHRTLSTGLITSAGQVFMVGFLRWVPMPGWKNSLGDHKAYDRTGISSDLFRNFEILDIHHRRCSTYHGRKFTTVVALLVGYDLTGCVSHPVGQSRGSRAKYEHIRSTRFHVLANSVLILYLAL